MFIKAKCHVLTMENIMYSWGGLRPNNFSYKSLDILITAKSGLAFYLLEFPRPVLISTEY